MKIRNMKKITNNFGNFIVLFFVVVDESVYF